MMLSVLENGETAVIGDVEAWLHESRLPDGPRTLLLGLLFAAFPLLGIRWIDPTCLTNPFEMVIFSFMCLGLLLGARQAHEAFVPAEPIAAAFIRKSQTLEIARQGLLGTSKIAIPFEDIASIRMARGDWNSDSVTAHPVVVLHNKTTLQLPVGPDDSEIKTIKLLSGLH